MRSQCPTIEQLSSKKFFEKIIYTRLYQHLIDDSVVINEQCGFRVNSSTDKATYKLLNEIFRALNNK
jgi:hypothetical protein